MAKKNSKLERPLHIFVSVGAAVVIFGAMAKILHLSWADWALKSGLTTEALIFLIYAFLPPDGHSAEAETKKGQNHISNLNEMLEKANLNQDSIQALSNNFTKFNNVVNTLYESSVFSQEFQQNLQIMNTNLVNLNTIYSQEIQNSAAQFKALNNSLHDLSLTSSSIASISSDAKATHQQLNNLNENLTKINHVYSGMLKAMTVK